MESVQEKYVQGARVVRSWLNPQEPRWLRLYEENKTVALLGSVVVVSATPDIISTLLRPLSMSLYHANLTNCHTTELTPAIAVRVSATRSVQFSLIAFVSFLLVSRAMEDQSASKLKSQVKASAVTAKKAATAAVETVEEKVKGAQFLLALSSGCLFSKTSDLRSKSSAAISFTAVTVASSKTPTKEISGLVGESSVRKHICECKLCQNNTSNSNDVNEIAQRVLRVLKRRMHSHLTICHCCHDVVNHRHSCWAQKCASTQGTQPS
jgi:hypothetical protein